MDSLLVTLTEAVVSIFNFVSIARIITRVIYSLTSGPYWKRVLITTSVFSVIVGAITFFVMR
ncbi:hypothetical protein A8M58_18295 [Yersinia pestis]|nr:hypothetical protein A8M58_18295 [Yersinia pestis]